MGTRPEPVVTRSLEQTEALGERLAASLRAGVTVLLYGDLGSGKTAFVRGLARGLGVDPDEVSSPTFVIIQEYHARSQEYHAPSQEYHARAQEHHARSESRERETLFHVDLYRVEGAAVDDLGLEELASRGIVAIEWADRLPRVPPDSVSVRIEDLGGSNRRIAIDRQPLNGGTAEGAK